MKPSRVSIFVHLRDHRVDAVKFQLWPQISDQGDFDMLAINVAIKIEDKGLEQRITNARGRGPAKIRDAGTPCAFSGNPNAHRINAVTRMDEFTKM